MNHDPSAWARWAESIATQNYRKGQPSSAPFLQMESEEFLPEGLHIIWCNKSRIVHGLYAGSVPCSFISSLQVWDTKCFPSLGLGVFVPKTQLSVDISQSFRNFFCSSRKDAAFFCGENKIFCLDQTDKEHWQESLLIQTVGCGQTKRRTKSHDHCLQFAVIFSLVFRINNPCEAPAIAGIFAAWVAELTFATGLADGRNMKRRTCRPQITANWSEKWWEMHKIVCYA